MILLSIPKPPSLNKLWAHVPGKRRVRSREYSAWLRDAGWDVKRQMIGMPTISCRYDLDIQVPISRRDTGNFEKAISDLLQSVGVVTNDGNAHRITITPVDRQDCAVCLTPLPEMGDVRGRTRTWTPSRPYRVGDVVALKNKAGRIAKMRCIRARTMV